MSNPDPPEPSQSKWQQFRSENKFVLFEYPFRRAAQAAMMVAITQYETTEELLKKVAPFLGGMYGN